MTRIVLSLTGMLVPLFIFARHVVNCPPPECVQGLTVTMSYQADGLCGANVFALDLLDGEPTQWDRPIGQYIQNEQGMYHIIGNAEEYLLTGESIGGSWLSLPSEVRTKNQYRQEDLRVGFRLVRVDQQ